ncbi:Molybdenum cofactor biosynthesis protein A [Gracilaria domingensis]|nr:Molybdenum cofactor biosynthesis protein A [Gracilaria domingensis]
MASLRAAPPLEDSFGRRHTYLRMSLTDRCNLRCAYCMPLHPEYSPKPHLLTTPEVLRLIDVFRATGVDKLRLTGGEPLMRQDLPQIIAAASPHLPVSITTNGVLLSRRLPELMDAGLSAVNLSLDSLCPHTFSLLTRRPPATHARVLRALDDALQQPSLAVKLNVVVMSPINDSSLPQFAALTEHQPLDVRFIEYMPFDGNEWHHGSFVPYSHMVQNLARHYGRLQHEPTHAADTSKYYRIPGFAGRIGFISSMSDHFCAGCNRLRVTADGALKTCLFGEHELSLRDLMRNGASDHELLEAIRHALQLKNFSLGGKRDMHALAAADNRSMVRIGG